MNLTYTETRRGYGALQVAYGPVEGDCCVIRDHDAAGMFWLGNVERPGGRALLLRRELNESDNLEYYISVRDQGRSALLAGPFYSHQAAIDQVRSVQALACKQDPWADFYQFGTCSAARGSGLKVRFAGWEGALA